MELQEERLTFRLAAPEDNVLKLVQPLPHPWLRGHRLEVVGICDEIPEYQELAAANARVVRMLASNVPARLIEQGVEQLEAHLQRLFKKLLTSAHLRFVTHVLFSGQSSIVPDGTVRFDQLGLPEEMAWILFEPFVIRELGDGDDVHQRSPRATEILDAVMARSWVLLNRRPSVMSTSILAFHPVRRGDRAIHLHPFVCPLAGADFDGDQVAIFLPVTPEAQREAGQRLSITAHLQRHPSLIESLVPTHDAMWGLAHLSLTPGGRQEIADIMGTDIAAPDGLVSRATLGQVLRGILDRQGGERVLTVLERLIRRGFAVAKASGASICAFIGTSLNRPPAPPHTDIDAWEAYREELTEQMTSRTDYDNNDLGVQLLAMKSGARGSIRHISLWFGGREVIADAAGTRVALLHGVADGLTTQEVYAGIFQAHEGLGRTLDAWQQLEYDIRAAHAIPSFNVLARAMRAYRPEMVFAHAAAIGEVDPLTDIDSRLFVGLPPYSAPGMGQA